MVQKVESGRIVGLSKYKKKMYEKLTSMKSDQEKMNVVRHSHRLHLVELISTIEFVHNRIEWNSSLQPIIINMSIL